ncbi:hypothetical protein JJQ72_10725 [Paenibacillus sp. F411]|uniref:hypothetical protein n=1 Tax=Paenibacillus sp. F411 TaxID=2820239 RepID=UPI001AAEE0C3|nr:hypothetical protein [Paenibacillus sp. F411]MBO2944443.1 hypothetical protein [Paenibacillus sp. F411]
MKRADFFYIWVAITGYIAGMLTYIISLWVTNGRFFINLELLMTWTLVTFFTVGTSFFFLCVVLLRAIRRYYFWLQTAVFIGVGIIPITMVAFMMGSFSVSNFKFVFSPEGVYFLMFFTSTALICSYGTWVAQKKLNKKPFLILSALIGAAFIIVMKLNAESI